MRKNALYLWSYVISGDWLKIAILSILICVVSVTNCQTLVIIREYNAFISLYDNWELNDNYFYTFGPFNRIDIESIRTLSTVENVVGINDIQGQGAAFIISQPYAGDSLPTEFMDSPESYVERIFWVHNLSNNQKDVSAIYNIKTTDGRTISRLEPNQILLDENAQKYFNKGDTIQISFDSYENDEMVIHTVSAEIVGFVSNDEYILDSGGGGYIGSLFGPMDDPDDPIAYIEIALGIPGNHLITSVFEYEDGYYNVEGEYPTMLIIKKSADVNYSDFKADLDSVGINTVEMKYSDDLMKEYKEYHLEEIRRAIIYEIVSIVVTLVIVITSFVEWFTHRKHELVIYNICGCSWMECIFLSTVPNLFAMVIGTLLATIVWNVDKYNAKVSPLFFCLMFVVYCLIYFAISTVYYFIYKNKSSSELYRNKE